MRPLSVFLAMLLGWVGSSAGAWAAPPHSPWNEKYFPNITLVNQEGKKLRFYDDIIKGDKVAVIHFFYTHCKEMCPAETANLRRVETLLGDHVGRDVFFYSISIDPKWDTPKALREYARKFNAGKSWTFLTGKASEITQLRKKLGVYSNGQDAKKLSNHSTSILVGNESMGHWIKRSAFDEPKVLARLLGNTLQRVPDSAFNGARSYAQAAQLPGRSHGEDLYRSRCISCHSLGADDGIGPGLAGVTRRRTQAWLTQWLKAPDKMLEQGDPIATELFARYKNVQMPNMSLSDADVVALIQFMEERSPRE